MRKVSSKSKPSVLTVNSCPSTVISISPVSKGIPDSLHERTNDHDPPTSSIGLLSSTSSDCTHENRSATRITTAVTVMTAMFFLFMISDWAK